MFIGVYHLTLLILTIQMYMYYDKSIRKVLDKIQKNKTKCCRDGGLNPHRLITSEIAKKHRPDDPFQLFVVYGLF